MNIASPTYLATDAYEGLLTSLVDLKPTLSQPDVRSAVIELLGEVANVWPDDIRSTALS